MFEHFPHTADLGLRVRAATLPELLVDAARGLTAMVVANPDSIRPEVLRTFTVQADEPGYLLFDWLSELLFVLESEKLAFSEFQIELTGLSLRATCRGELLDWDRHRLEHEVKAITYHALVCRESRDGWEAEVIVDI